MEDDLQKRDKNIMMKKELKNDLETYCYDL